MTSPDVKGEEEPQAVSPDRGVALNMPKKSEAAGGSPMTPSTTRTGTVPSSTTAPLGEKPTTDTADAALEKDPAADTIEDTQRQMTKAGGSANEKRNSTKLPEDSLHDNAASASRTTTPTSAGESPSSRRTNEGHVPDTAANDGQKAERPDANSDDERIRHKMDSNQHGDARLLPHKFKRRKVAAEAASATERESTSTGTTSTTATATTSTATAESSSSTTASAGGNSGSGTFTTNGISFAIPSTSLSREIGNLVAEAAAAGPTAGVVAGSGDPAAAAAAAAKVSSDPAQDASSASAASDHAKAAKDTSGVPVQEPQPQPQAEAEAAAATAAAAAQGSPAEQYQQLQQLVAQKREQLAVAILAQQQQQQQQQHLASAATLSNLGALGGSSGAGLGLGLGLGLGTGTAADIAQAQAQAQAQVQAAASLSSPSMNSALSSYLMGASAASPNSLAGLRGIVSGQTNNPYYDILSSQNQALSSQLGAYNPLSATSMGMDLSTMAASAMLQHQSDLEYLQQLRNRRNLLSSMSASAAAASLSASAALGMTPDNAALLARLQNSGTSGAAGSGTLSTTSSSVGFPSSSAASPSPAASAAAAATAQSPGNPAASARNESTKTSEAPPLPNITTAAAKAPADQRITRSDGIVCLASGIPHYSSRTFMNLSAPDDVHWLSTYLCFVREKCIEVFEASDKDLQVRNNAKLFHDRQIGIRCPYCAHIHQRDRAGRSSSFPSSISRIYQSLTMMLREHYPTCTEMPPAIKKKFLALKGQKQGGPVHGLKRGQRGSDISAKESRSYWVDSAKEIGLYDTDQGIKRRAPPTANPGQQVSSLPSKGS